jgi:endonuclease/exonuclease/phosphatase (EEP) superfamily protein YafD
LIALPRLARKIAIVLATLSLAGLLLGRFGTLAWPLDLPSHFRLQYAIVLALSGVTLIGLEPRWFGIVSLIASAACGFTFIRYTYGAESVAASAPQLRVVSLNVWFRNRDDARIAHFLEASGADVIALQEMTVLRARELHELLPSYRYAFIERAQPHGAAIFSRLPITDTGVVELADGGVNASRVELTWHDRQITLLGMHLHWPIGAAALRDAEIEGLARFARSHAGPLVIVGDFNITPWSAAFGAAMTDAGLDDCARGRGWLPTWPSQFPPLGIRIDQCLVSADWEVIGARAGPRVGSDHLPMTYDLTLGN